MRFDQTKKCRATFLLVQDGLSDKEKIKLAVSMFGLYSTVNFLRHACSDGPWNFQSLLRLFTKQGAEELYQILRCAYREMKQGKYKDEATVETQAGATQATTPPKAEMRAVEHEQVLVLQTKARKSKTCTGTGTRYENRDEGPGTNAACAAGCRHRGHNTQT